MFQVSAAVGRSLVASLTWGLLAIFPVWRRLSASRHAKYANIRLGMSDQIMAFRAPATSATDAQLMLAAARLRGMSPYSINGATTAVPRAAVSNT